MQQPKTYSVNCSMTARDRETHRPFDPNAVDGLEVFCRLWDIAIAKISESSGDKCAKPKSAFDYKSFRAGMEKQDASGVAEHVEDSI